MLSIVNNHDQYKQQNYVQGRGSYTSLYKPQ